MLGEVGMVEMRLTTFARLAGSSPLLPVRSSKFEAGLPPTYSISPGALVIVTLPAAIRRGVLTLIEPITVIEFWLVTVSAALTAVMLLIVIDGSPPGGVIGPVPGL